MGIDVEGRLKDFAHKLVADHLIAEYDYQIEEWRTAIDRLVEAQRAAVDKMKQVLEAAQKSIISAQQSQMNHAMSIMAFLLVGGPATSWLGAYAQYVLFPKFGSKVVSRRAYVSAGDAYLAYGVDKDFDRAVITMKEPNQLRGQVFGDMTKLAAGGLIGFGVDKLMKPDPLQIGPDVQSAVARVFATSDSFSFGMNLRETLRTQATVTKKQIYSLAMKILLDNDWGKDCLKRLQRIEPRAKSAKSDEERLLLGQRMIISDIDRTRKEWADISQGGWFLYGRSPAIVNIEATSEAIELDAWATWLLQSDFKVKKVPYRRGDVSTTTDHVIGSDGFDLTLARPVLDRLVDFDIIEGAPGKQRSAQTARADQKAWADESLKERGHTPDPHQPPMLDLGWSVTSEREINMLSSWASNHVPHINGRLRSVSRYLGSIVDVHK